MGMRQNNKQLRTCGLATATASLGMTRRGRFMNITIADPCPPISINAHWKWRFAIAFCLLFAIAIAPIVSAAMPMLTDYPNHLARMYILMADGRSPELNRFYSVEWQLMPNLAMDLIVPPLARIVGIYLAGKIFLALTLLLLASGTIALHFALHRRLSPWPLMVMLLLYNQMFLYGVLNFLFGLGIALWGIAAWVWAMREPRWWNAPLLASIATLVWISHLSAFGVLALITGALAISNLPGAQPPIRRFLLLAATLALPVFLTISYIATKAPTSAEPAEHGLATVLYLVLKLLKLLTTFMAFNRATDVIITIFVFGLIAFGFIRKYLVLHPAMKLPLGLIVIAYFLMPPMLLRSALADYRVMIAAQFLFISSVDFRPLATSLQLRVISLGLVAAFSIRSIGIADRWEDADRLAKAALAAFERMEHGSRLFPAIRFEHSGETFAGNYELFLPTLAALSRSAFVPSLYTLPGAQPVVLTPAYERIRSRQPQSRIPVGADPDWAHVTANYDYVWVPTRDHFSRLPSHKLRLLDSHPQFRLYQVIAR